MNSEEPRPDGRDAEDPDAARQDQTADSDSHKPPGGNGGAKRTALELVEGVGGDAHREEERQHRRGEAPGVGVRRERAHR